MAAKMHVSTNSVEFPSSAGDLADLQMYLHRQFEQQSTLLESMHHDIRTLMLQGEISNFLDPTASASAPLSPPLPPSPPPVAAAPAAPAAPAAAPTLEIAPTLELTAVMSMDSEGTPEQSRPRPVRSSMLSGRHTFVRSAMLERHLQARKKQETQDEERDIEEILRGDWGPEPTGKIRLRKFVLSPLFANIIMVFVIGNALLLGIEIDVSSTVGQDDVPVFFGIANLVFVVVFLTETLLKLLVLGCYEYWRGPDSNWNIFDFVIVSLSVAETCLELFSQAINNDGSQASIRVMRTLRIARTLRSVRLFRVLRHFSALRGLLVSIGSTLWSLIWTLVLLQMLFYVFGVIFAQLVTDHCRFQTIESTENRNAIPKCPEELHYWATVMDSMHTLFMSITGGLNWFDAYDPLREVTVVALWLLNLFIVVGVFTILNVVTGVFVNTAIEGAAADKEMAILKQAQFRLSQISALKDVFKEIATEQRETLNINDLEDALNEDKLGDFMASMGISTDDVWTLFLLIDVDANGHVDIEEFVSGCLQLRGPAQSLQVAKMSYENKLTRQKISLIMKDMEQVKDGLDRLMKFRAPRRLISAQL